MLDYKKYESYRETEIPWIGQIPSQWQLVLLSQVVTQVKNKNTALQENNLLSLSYGRIKRKPIDSSGGLLPESFEGYNIIEENDIVLRLTDLQNDHTSLRVGISPEKGIITSAYTTMRPRNNSCAKYLFYLLHTFDIRKGFYGMGSGVRQGLNYDEVNRLQIPWPTVEEQIHVSEYLDRETGKINAIISEAKASIEEYKTWKASIIYEAVTKGLDPNAEMKESGVQFIGLIPESWAVVKFKRIASVEPNLISPEGYDSFKQIAPDCIEKGSGRLVKERSVEEAGVVSWNQLFKKGQILYSKIRPVLNKVIIAPFDGLCSADMYPISARINTEFLLYSMLSQSFVGQVDLITRDRVKMPKINQDELGSVMVAVPPTKEEQRQIAEMICIKTAEIDAILREKEALVSELERYKKSLIFEVVTGKRRVC